MCSFFDYVTMSWFLLLLGLMWFTLKYVLILSTPYNELYFCSHLHICSHHSQSAGLTWLSPEGGWHFSSFHILDNSLIAAKDEQEENTGLKFDLAFLRYRAPNLRFTCNYRLIYNFKQL